MKKLDYKLGIILFLVMIVVIQFLRGPEIKEVERIVEVEVEVLVPDSIPYEVPVEVIYEVPYEVEVEKIVIDTFIVEKPVKVPFEVIKEVDKIVEREVERPKESQWYLGMGYEFGINPMFGGTSTRLLYKTKSDKMFGIDLGVRNHITNFETMQGQIKPYFGGSIYIKIK
jgi:transposase